jgi:hypothetical protein
MIDAGAALVRGRLFVAAAHTVGIGLGLVALQVW